MSRWRWLQVLGLGALGIWFLELVPACKPFVPPRDAGVEATAPTHDDAGSDADALDDSAAPPTDAPQGADAAPDAPPYGVSDSGRNEVPLPAVDAPPETRPCTAGATPLRQIGPLSTSYATAVRPTFKWEGGGTCGVTVDLCPDADCTTVTQTIDAAPGSASSRPSADLPRGVTFWRARSGAESTPVWSVFIGKGTPVDSSGGTFSDFNGDGRSDVVVAADKATVFVYYGGPGGIGSVPSVLEIPDVPRFDAGQGLIGSAGDVSGDGLADIVIVSPPTTDDPHARLHLFLGRKGGVLPTPTLSLSVGMFTPDGVLAVKGGIDVNKDGYGDILLVGDGDVLPIFGAPTSVLEGNGALSEASGLSLTGDDIALCDVDGDGISDFVALLAQPAGGPVPAVFRGTGSSFLWDKRALASHGEGNEAFAHISCADVQGDGFPEILAGAPYSSVRDIGAGDVVVFANVGGAPSLTGAGLVGLDKDHAPSKLTRVRDMNGDGLDEVAVGLGGELGVAQVAFSALSGAPADMVEIGGTPDTRGGFGVAFAPGDFDGDGLADLITSSTSFANAGRLTLFRGSRVARLLTPSVVHVDPPPGTSLFGVQLASAQ